MRVKCKKKNKIILAKVIRRPRIRRLVYFASIRKFTASHCCNN